MLMLKGRLKRSFPSFLFLLLLLSLIGCQKTAEMTTLSVSGMA